MRIPRIFRSASARQLTIAISLIFLSASVLIPEDSQDTLAFAPSPALSIGYFDDSADDVQPFGTNGKIHGSVIYISCLSGIQENPVTNVPEEDVTISSFILHLSRSNRGPPTIV